MLQNGVILVPQVEWVNFAEETECEDCPEFGGR